MMGIKKLEGAFAAPALPVLAFFSLWGWGCSSLRPWEVKADFRFEPVAERSVEVVIWQDSAQCLVLPLTARATLDGTALELVEPGHQISATTRILIESLPRPSCAWPRFRTKPDWVPVLTTRSELAIEVDGRRGAVEINDFLYPRKIELVSAPALVPGKEVILRWLPASDEWDEDRRTAAVVLYWPDEFLLRVEAPRLSRVGNTFRFVMPQVRPGPVRLRLIPGEPGPQPSVLHCKSFASCEAGLSGDPPELELVALPVPSSLP